MSEILTFEQVTAAQNSDIEATTAVINATESRVVGLAAKAARRLSFEGVGYRDLVDELSQVGRIAVWESLARYKGDSVDGFYAFIYSTVENALRDAARDMRNSGADKDAIKEFGRMLRMADGDVYLAEKFCQTVPPKGERLSADRANAARLAWQGSDSIDLPASDGAERLPVSGDNTLTIGETLHGSIGIPHEIDATTLVGRGQVINAANQLAGCVAAPAGDTDREVLVSALTSLADGYATADAVDELESVITVPKDEHDRASVMDALALLRSAACMAPASDEPDSSTAEAVRRKHAVVNTILSAMGEGQRTVLQHSFGIAGATYYGHGDSGDDCGMSEETGMSLAKIRDARTKGLKAFAKRYVKAVEATHPEHADQLAEAAAQQLSRGGRK